MENSAVSELCLINPIMQISDVSWLNKELWQA